MYSIIVVLFSLFIMLEGLSFIVRAAGVKSGKPLLGIVFTNQLLSVSRIVSFLVAPSVGLISDLYSDPKLILYLGLMSISLGLLFLIIELTVWFNIISTVESFISTIARDGDTLKSFKQLFAKQHKIKLVSFKLNPPIFFAQVITSGMTCASIFSVNILALKFPDYTATLIQMTTVISGIGNLLYNFYTMPKITAIETKSNHLSIMNAHLSAFVARIIGIGFLSPIIIIFVWSV